MGIFDKILKGLGIKKDDDAKNTDAGASAKPKAGATAAPRATLKTGLGSSKPAAMDAVDVAAKMDALAKANPQELNWKVSIVDLLKLLDIDSSFENRKELAIELGVPTEYLEDSAKMNTWLHKTVLKKIAENGGNVPASLLD
ncbi:MAG TPA: DUF3597 domain-containing protein [Anaerolineales bacterium]|nr:DUF3597 domain-containing protein [Anaerolineales bacterium]HRQ93219.1 DUF3597 domain-containing protein [Anaerolineales bacterium]